jgi:alpha-ribazole phosphatase
MSDEGKTCVIMERHGATEFDTDEGDAQINGQLPTPDDEGREESGNLSDQLRDENLSMIISSDLPRAKETADIVAKPHGIMVNPVAAIRAWDLGFLVGKPIYDVVRNSVKEYVINHDVVVPGGESYDALMHRLFTYVGKVLDGCGDESILMITHGYNVNLVRQWLESGRDLEQMLLDPTRLITKTDPVKPGGYVRLEKNDDGDWEVVDEWRTSGGAKVVS